MKLAFDQIKKITLGAVRIEQHSEGIHFYRFTKEQEEYYAATEYATPPKHLATAGIRLLFRTDSRSLKLKVEVIAASSATHGILLRPYSPFRQRHNARCIKAGGGVALDPNSERQTDSELHGFVQEDAASVQATGQFLLLRNRTRRGQTDGERLEP